MEYLKIKNWDKWQTYRSDRGQPPWIKIHRCVMRNLEWISLTDAERGQLVAIWLLAADHNGVIPASPEMIQKVCYLETPPNLNKFIKLEFIENNPNYNDATTTPPRRQHDQPKAEKSRIDKNRDKDAFTLSFEKFWNAYPLKNKKPLAFKAWIKENKNTPLRNEKP